MQHRTGIGAENPATQQKGRVILDTVGLDIKLLDPGGRPKFRGLMYLCLLRGTPLNIIMYINVKNSM